MDFCVWKPAKSMDAKDPDIAAITAAALGAKMKKSAGRNASEPEQEVSVEETIRTNLQRIAEGANHFMLEEGVAQASFKDLNGEYFKPIQSANGENYENIVVKSGQKAISVTDEDGIEHTVQLR